MNISNINQTRLSNYPHFFHEKNSDQMVSLGQCDCAYPTDWKLPVGLYPFINNFHFMKTPMLSFPIGNDYHAAISKGAGFFNLNSAALNLLDQFSQHCSLEHMKAILRNRWNDETIADIIAQMIELRFLVPDSGTSAEFEDCDTALSAWIHITDQCNLRCNYCYLTAKSSMLSFETGKAIIDAVFRSALIHGYKTIRLKYAGGEPLIGFDLMIKLHRYACNIAAHHQLSLEGVILSNGTLLPQIKIHQARDLGLKLVISLDGPEKYHNHNRCYADGSGSFQDVSIGLNHCLDAGLIPGVAITVCSHAVDGLPELLAWTIEKGLPFRINFYRENRRTSSRTEMRLEEEKMIQGMLAAYSAIASKPLRRSLLGSLGDHVSFFAPRERPCNAGRSYLVFDADGNVAKCQMEIQKIITNANHPDPLGVIRHSQAGLRNPSVDEKPECRSCQWKYWCAGGCPLSAYWSVGKYEAKSPYCQIYQKLFPEIIRIEGQRLLKASNCG